MPQPPDADDVRPPTRLTVDQVADREHVDPTTVRRWIKRGQLPAHRLGPRLIRIDPADLDAFLNRPVQPRGGDSTTRAAS